MNGTDWGRKFRYFQETYRKPDGRKWTNMDIERATNGFVRGNYITNLKNGRIHQPGLDRLRAIAQVMGFPEELWLRKDRELPTTMQEGGANEGGPTLADRLNALFNVTINQDTGKPFTNRELADLTYGRIDEETLAAARDGRVTDLQGGQYIALSNVFGVDVSYWYVQPDELPPLDPPTNIALRDEMTREVLHKFHGRSDEQKKLILAMLDQLAASDKDVG